MEESHLFYCNSARWLLLLHSYELIEHLAASVQAAPSAAEISRISRCMAHCDMEQFDLESDFRSLSK